MTGRQVYALYRDAHGGETGMRLDNFDTLATATRMVWERLAEAVYEAVEDDMRERKLIP